MDSWQQVLSYTFGLLWGLWPVLLLAGAAVWGGSRLASYRFEGEIVSDSSGRQVVSGGFRRVTRFFVGFAVVWFLLALMRLWLVFNPAPIFFVLMPEPLSTVVFVLVGVGVLAVYVLVRAFRGVSRARR